MPLTDAQLRKAKPSARQVKLFDGRGLFLSVQPTGGKLWRMKYRFHGREKLLSLGAYPEVSLADAREKCTDARRLIAAGVDPAQKKKDLKVAGSNSVEAVAKEWLEKQKKKWAESYWKKVEGRLEQYVYPQIGSRPIADVTPPELLRVLQRVEATGAHETALRIRQTCGAIWRYAIASGRAERDAAADLKDALSPATSTHFAAVTEPEKAGALLNILDGYDGTPIVRCALRLAPLVFVRPGELRKAQWSEINLEKAQWSIPPWRTKMKTPLLVPLSRQAVEILREIEPLTGRGKYVFPSARGGDRPMSDNAILAAMRRSGIDKEEMTGHGFRALARTVLDEVLGVRVDLIEHQLGHAVKDPNGRAYNRTSFLKERVAMMQQWADYLDEVKAGKQKERLA